MGGRQAWGQFAVSLEAGPGGLRVLPHRDIWGKTVSRVTGVQLSPWKNGVSFSQTGVLQAEVLSSVKKIMVLFGQAAFGAVLSNCPGGSCLGYTRALSRWWVLFRAWEGREGSPVVGLGPKLVVMRAGPASGPPTPLQGPRRQCGGAGSGVPAGLVSLCSDPATFAGHCRLAAAALLLAWPPDRVRRMALPPQGEAGAGDSWHWRERGARVRWVGESGWRPSGLR